MGEALTMVLPMVPGHVVLVIGQETRPRSMRLLHPPHSPLFSLYYPTSALTMAGT